MSQPLPQLRDLASAASLEAGRLILAAGTAEAERKGAGDYVTAVDRAAERAIKEVLETGAPDIPVVGEETGGEAASRYWLVDPLDGTTNFVHRFPAVGVSIALVEEGRPVIGVVHAPFLGTTYDGALGLGARRDGREIRVSGASPDTAIVGTGFPFRDKRRMPEYLGLFHAALERFEDLRRPGAVALDLAWVAEGVFDGFFELNLGPWDVAAGALLVREAGGVVTDWHGDDAAWLRTGDILAGPPAIHGALLDISRRARSKR